MDLFLKKVGPSQVLSQSSVAVKIGILAEAIYLTVNSITLLQKIHLYIQLSHLG